MAIKNERLLVLFVSLLHIVTRVGCHPARRPFYNIAHMVNSIDDIERYVSLGANAIETDVQFSHDGIAQVIFHGFPCDCFRNCYDEADITEYLEYVREITRPESPHYKQSLLLLQLDIKMSSLSQQAVIVAGRDVASKILVSLYPNGKCDCRVKVLITVGNARFSEDFILSFQSELERRNLTDALGDKIGWDFGMHKPISTIMSTWDRIGNIKNVWISDGITNCLNPLLDYTRLNLALKMRDDHNTVVKKVYRWTVDSRKDLQKLLRKGVDGIITNRPERVEALLRDEDFRKQFRMAGHDDNPWEAFKAPQH